MTETTNPAARNARYDNVAISLHWAIMLLILSLYGIGWYMVDTPDGSLIRTKLFALHKSIGLTTALLILCRIIWRITHIPPTLPETVQPWQNKLASLTHLFLYFLMVLQPLSGYLSSSFSGYKTRVWGIPLPQWGWKEPVLNQLFTDIHVLSSVTLLCLIILHICGAFSHLFLRHGNVLPRMWPGSSRRKQPG